MSRRVYRSEARWLAVVRQITGRKLVEVLAILVGMLVAGTVWAAMQNAELETRLHAMGETARLYADSTALLRSLCVVPDRIGHEDARMQLLAAQAERIPPVVLFGVIAHESGYSARYDLTGKVGEHGRAQIRYELWNDLSPSCTKRDPESQLRCAAQILRYCRERYGDWRSGIACYNATESPDTLGRYLAGVERQVGRMVLRGMP